MPLFSFSSFSSSSSPPAPPAPLPPPSRPPSPPSSSPRHSKPHRRKEEEGKVQPQLSSDPHFLGGRRRGRTKVETTFTGRKEGEGSKTVTLIGVRTLRKKGGWKKKFSSSTLLFPILFCLLSRLGGTFQHWGIGPSKLPPSALAVESKRGRGGGGGGMDGVWGRRHPHPNPTQVLRKSVGPWAN